MPLKENMLIQMFLNKITQTMAVFTKIHSQPWRFASTLLNNSVHWLVKFTLSEHLYCGCSWRVVSWASDRSLGLLILLGLRGLPTYQWVIPSRSGAFRQTCIKKSHEWKLQWGIELDESKNNFWKEWKQTIY